ncbi:MAG: DMT family transporter [Tabrizicola sp.]|uniref:DMT family transporter n=1 Tax=Tabrizicola sp. TaxID=2005166 RepID=UPI002734AAC1|nr:DMT family transporter [Tabrizicola sp.]MDP3262171.1 DMT family transporter [Tabrizicola sp.]MDP3648083.1 DMT family transporter [Paracoccaceae bacterium]MDZ4066993.1 DMT family transporter [Tabrizicola sp.]
MLAIVLSLGAAATFALSAMLIDRVNGRVAILQLARWQMGIAFAVTLAVSALVGGWQTVAAWQFGLLAASSAAGIMLASLTYFGAIMFAGPRISALLFTLASPFALLMGYLALGETVSVGQGAGIALILFGIMLAITAPADAPVVGRLARPFWQGIALGVITSVGQAAGSLLARPAMAAGVEPVTAMAIRSGLGFAFFLALMAIPMARRAMPLGRFELVNIGGSAILGMFIGMSFLMAALARGDVGIVSTFSSTTPILILPMLWATTGKRPTVAAWVGAILAVAGTALISLA